MSLTISCILPGVSCGYLKWNFRKLCQHPFNLSSCETSSISHNPLSSYYCCWISSCGLCKMKLYFWCQASSNVVKLTIFYKEPFYSIQNPFVNFIALHVWGQFCLYWTDDVQYTNYTKYSLIQDLSDCLFYPLYSTCILLLATKTRTDL